MTTTIESILADDLRPVMGDETQCVARIAQLWREADILPHYPASSETTSELLRIGGGYDAAITLLESWARDKKVDGVGIRNGRFAWTARGILQAMLLLDCGRRFAPLDRRHLHRLSSAELVEMQARVAGQSGFSDLAEFDVNGMLEIIARCDDTDLRRVFVTAMKAKLRGIDEGILDK